MRDLGRKLKSPITKSARVLLWSHLLDVFGRKNVCFSSLSCIFRGARSQSFAPHSPQTRLWETNLAGPLGAAATTALCSPTLPLLPRPASDGDDTSLPHATHPASMTSNAGYTSGRSESAADAHARILPQRCTRRTHSPQGSCGRPSVQAACRRQSRGHALVLKFHPKSHRLLEKRSRFRAETLSLLRGLMC